MAIRVGKYAGFCFGVRNAVDAAFAAVAKGGDCYALGPLIHNQQVLDRLQQAGIRTVDSLDQVTHGTVVIRSHGVGPKVLAECAARGLSVVDATCPFVQRVHTLVEAYSRMGDSVIVAGQADHPEVQGTAGWCAGSVYVVENAEQ
ncbi:MAG: bifunctional 4-hydroxy-3-methylbut-2-enyl diphosphate reductase/30S ribosomal protein S1, partial [Clostridia bacterium]